MGTPLPNPKDGRPTATTSSDDPDRAEDARGPRRSPPHPVAPPETHENILATPSQLHTRVQYVPLDLKSLSIPGPSGIKQCFRTVKSIRRIPTLPKFAPKPSSSSSSISGPTIAIKPAQELTTSVLKKRIPPKLEAPQSSNIPKVAKKHVCYVCSKRFSSPGKLSQHVLSHTGELPFNCLYCDKKFNTKFKLVRHGLIHSESRAFACMLCDKTFHRKDHLNNHARVHNPVKNLYICEKENCKKQYTSLLSFKKHVALHSAEEGNLECKICLKTFDSQTDIVYHLKVHAGSRTIKNEDDKKFKCSFCGRKFFTNKDVRRHLVVHTGRRDFCCQFCPQKFGRKDHLVRHMKNAHPDAQWQSSTVGASGEALNQPTPSTSKAQPAPQKKSKGAARKSSVSKVKKKAPPRMQIFQSGGPFSSDPTFIIKSIPFVSTIEKVSEESESSDTSHHLLTVQQLKSEPELPPPLIDTGQGIRMQGNVKNEPIVEIKIEEDDDVLYEPMPSTSKDLPPLLCSQESSEEDLSKYPAFGPNVVYVMPPPPPYPDISSQMDILEPSAEISFSSDQNIEGVMSDLESEVDPLTLLDQSGVQAILIDASESNEELETLSNQQIMQLLETTDIVVSEQQGTVLPTFNQAFQNTAQSPKPPQHPPGSDL